MDRLRVSWSRFWDGPNLGELVSCIDDFAEGDRRSFSVLSSISAAPPPGPGRESQANVQAQDPRPILIQATRLSLTTWEIKTLQNTWRKLKDYHEGELFQRVFAMVFTKRPEIKRMFGLRDVPLEIVMNDHIIKRHSLLTQDTMDMIVSTLASHNGQLASQLITFGSQHYFYTRRSLEAIDWLIFGDAFLTLFAQFPHTRNKVKRWKTLRLWKKFIYFVLACIQVGYMSGDEKVAKKGAAKRGNSIGSHKKRSAPTIQVTRSRRNSPPSNPTAAVQEQELARKLSVGVGTGPGFRPDGSPRIETHLLGVCLLNFPARV